MSSSAIYSEYDSFAWFYNLYWGGDFCRPALGIYEVVLFPQLQRGARILDLCCGTGQLAAALAERGYRVTGVDGSAVMLDYASENAPTVEFMQADVREIHLPPQFDTTISAFDSLNHIMSLQELTQVFHNVYAALKTDGIFLFDLNLETEEDARPQILDVVADDHACIVQATYDELKKLKQYQVTMFRREGKAWQRSDLTLQQRYYQEATVIGALAEAGFKRIRTYDARHEFGMKLSDGRMFFMARK